MSNFSLLVLISLLVALSKCELKNSNEQTTEAQYDGIEGTTTEYYGNLEDEVQGQEDDIRSKECKCGEGGTIEPLVNLESKLAQKRRRFETASPLIVGGNDAGEDEFPWMAVISKKRAYEPNKIICGGSVINSRFILTAAHCISSQYPNLLEIWLRAHNSSNIKNNKKVIKLKVRRLIPHPQWDEKTVSNDIGLIEVSAPILFSSQNINPVCLPTKDDGDFSNENGTVIGFGFRRPSGFMAKVLQKLTVPILSHEECTKTKYGEIISSNPSFLCAGFDEGGKDACTNDSGGPLTVIRNGKHKLAGIVSWGHGCAQPQLPGVYTRVTKYIDWIDSIVKPSTRCLPKK